MMNRDQPQNQILLFFIIKPMLIVQYIKTFKIYMILKVNPVLIHTIRDEKLIELCQTFLFHKCKWNPHILQYAYVNENNSHPNTYSSHLQIDQGIQLNSTTLQNSIWLVFA